MSNRVLRIRTETAKTIGIDNRETREKKSRWRNPFHRIRGWSILVSMDGEIIFKEESYRITGACFEVYLEKGCGFLEAVYQECVEIELRLQEIPFVPQKPLALEYKGTPLCSRYEPDFICYDKIILELKAVKDLADEHRAQVHNYLKATGFQLGILANFGYFPKLQVERIVNTRGRYAQDHK
jgi:GxxExxY protein